ncbi:DNA gyrase inhibitor YacG [Palleronia sp. KMU-117]|uniref:DNA gyrase inhibitor YacG n=1 Tax=Palleronia sp. KMU-117 TaxID=3434108 RepID=UPI003D765117
MSCPICSKPATKAYRPFCSRRCADVDLGRWLTGGYAVPGDPVEVDDQSGGDDGETPPKH